MAAPALAPPDVWKAIRTASIKGVSDTQLAEYFNVTVGAIQSRRFDDPDWKAAKKDQAPHRTNNRERKFKEADPKQVAKHVEAISTLTLQEIGERSSVLLARYSASKIQEAAESDLLPAPSDWSQLKTASEILRKATGQDRDQAPVTLNLFGSASFGEPEGAVIDLPVETQEVEEGDFC